jgi:ferritin
MSEEIKFRSLIEEAIDLELNVSALYALFYRQYKEDADFWWNLVIEEQNHAALLKTVLQMTHSNVDIPKEILPEGIQELKNSNAKLVLLFKEFEDKPDRIMAFQKAYEVEHLAGELHFDAFMSQESDSRITDVFKKLNGEDKNHAERIRTYMTENNIPISAD